MGTPPAEATSSGADPAGGRSDTTARFPGGLARPAAAWASVALVATAIQALGSGWPDRTSGLINGWNHFDGPEYLSIALEGYQGRQLVWFPLYPLLVRAVHGLLGDPQASGVLVTLVGGLAAACLCWRWLELRVASVAARRAGLAVLLLYPYGWFLYGAIYSDSVFVAAALGAFVLVERDRPLAAGLVAVACTAGRPSGTAVVVGLLLVTWERAGILTVAPGATGWRAALRLPTHVDRRAIRARHLAPLVGFGGLVGYGAYQWIRWDSPVRFVTEQSRYHDSGNSSLLKVQYFESWYHGFDGRHLATTTAQAVLLAVVLTSVPAVGRRFGWGYGVYVLLLAGLPALSVSTFMGVGRYLIPAFPCFALLGEWLSERSAARWATLSCSAVVLAVLTYGFSRSWYLT